MHYSSCELSSLDVADRIDSRGCLRASATITLRATKRFYVGGADERKRFTQCSARDTAKSELTATADWLWAAVLHRTAERRADVFIPASTTAPLRQRIASSTRSTTALPQPVRARLRTCAPRCRATPPNSNGSTRARAAELQSFGRGWLATCLEAFAGLDVDPDRVNEVASFIPGAMRGITSERQLGSYNDLDVARQGLTNAIVAYLQARPA